MEGFFAVEGEKGALVQTFGGETVKEYTEAQILAFMHKSNKEFFGIIPP
jgi:hypothetical protein